MMGQEERAPSTLGTRCSSRGSTRTTKNQSSKNKEQRRSDRLLLWNWLQEIIVWHVEYLAPTLTTVTRGDTLVYSRELRLNYIQNEYHILPKNPCFSTFPETLYILLKDILTLSGKICRTRIFVGGEISGVLKTASNRISRWNNFSFSHLSNKVVEFKSQAKSNYV